MKIAAVALLFVAFPALAAEPPHRPARAEQQRLSAIEEAYARRAGQPLRLFGHELFVAPPAVPASPPGAIQDDHVLTVGDELTVTLRGQRSATQKVRIDGGGQIVVDELPPISAAGRSLGAVRAEVEAEVKAALPHTQAFVSLTAIHRTPVLVLGEVARPGRVEVGGFGTVLDALLAAGGVTPSGSLRRIRVVGPERERAVDLYDLLLRGRGGADERLRRGDRILVPPIGPTIAIAGDVLRPGVYELGEDADPTAAEALELAGGPLRPGPLRLLRLGFAADGAETTAEIAEPAASPLVNGDLLIVRPAQEERVGSVTLLGHVRRPGLRALGTANSVAALAAETEFLPSPYLPFAVLQRTGPDGRTRALHAVDLGAVLDGRTDVALRADDALVVLSGRDVEFLTSRPVLALLGKGRLAPVPACVGLEVLARRLSADPQGVLAAGPLGQGASALVPADLPCPPVFDQLPDLLSFALDHAVLMRRGMPRPGLYPVASETALDRLARLAGVPPDDLPGARLAVVGGLGPSPHENRVGPGGIIDATAPRLHLVGHLRHPGTRPLPEGTTLRSLLADGRQILPGAYPLFGVIERFDGKTLSRQLLPFSPRDVIAGLADRRLADEDRVRVFSAAEIETYLAAPPEPPARNPDPPPDRAHAGVDPVLHSLLREHSLTVRGAVRRPGIYPVAETARIAAVIEAAGGLTAQADPSAVEVTSDHPGTGNGRLGAERRRIDLTVPVGSLAEVARGDTVRIGARASEREERAVAILGEVRHPGEYDLVRGETLASLIARAGGLTDQAYPAGAVFTRESARRREAAGFERAAHELDRGLALALLGQKPPPAEQVALARQLAGELRSVQALGRLTVEADPAVLAQRPELDILLEPGDRIEIPRRPLTVTVSGEVLAPASLQFAPGKTAADYMREAGGLTRWADARRAFVLLPNGSAQPISDSPWQHRPPLIPPGATIIVPRDPEPFDFIAFSTSISGLLSQLAISAASLTFLADR